MATTTHYERTPRQMIGVRRTQRGGVSSVKALLRRRPLLPDQDRNQDRTGPPDIRRRQGALGAEIFPTGPALRCLSLLGEHLRARQQRSGEPGLFHRRRQQRQLRREIGVRRRHGQVLIRPQSWCRSGLFLTHRKHEAKPSLNFPYGTTVTS